MEFWFCFYWLYLWTTMVSTDPTYTIHRSELSFDEATDACLPAILPTIATQQEVSAILTSIASAVPPVHKKFTFWVGLKKLKEDCVVATLPLRGFKWTENQSEESQVNRWREEPKHTCTTVRCAAMTGELDGTSVTDWGLISISCKNQHQFICKQRDGQVGGPPLPEPDPVPEPEPEFKPLTPQTGTETLSTTPDPEPNQPKSSSSAPEPKQPGSSSSAPELNQAGFASTTEGGQDPPISEFSTPEPVTSEHTQPTPEPAYELKPDLLELYPHLQSGSCENPKINGSRVLIPDPDNSIKMGVECWSGVRLQLHCRDTVWFLSDSPVNITSACWPCDAGFNKDPSGRCVDVDECKVGPAPCRHTCLNTEGSFRCVCFSDDGKQHEEGSADCTAVPEETALSGILIPVLGAVAVLVLLVIIIAVAVKCCLMRRSKQHAVEEAEKVAMKSKKEMESAEIMA